MTHQAPTLLDISGLKVHFPIPTGFLSHTMLKAVDDISFTLQAGEILGIVGESGCGKSTLGRAILSLIAKSEGKVLWMGQDLDSQSEKQIRSFRKEMQIIFQDPLASLDPRFTVGEIIAEPLQTHFPHLSKQERLQQVQAMMNRVGLLPQMINRYPHEFSGGQCQRIGIARAMILKPKLIICDEPVSALDVSIQAQILNLLKELQQEFGLSLIFISHDLSVIRHISQKILVLYLGKIVEQADRHSLFANPKHPYTKALLSAIPIPNPEIERTKEIIELKGDLPSPLSPPSGCNFHTRCPFVKDICQKKVPKTKYINAKQSYTCHLD